MNNNDSASIEAQFERYCQTNEFDREGTLPFIKRVCNALLEDVTMVEKPAYWDAWTVERQYGYNSAVEAVKQRVEYLRSRFNLPN